jgi:hypothetical protein
MLGGGGTAGAITMGGPSMVGRMTLEMVMEANRAGAITQRANLVLSALVHASKGALDAKSAREEAARRQRQGQRRPAR